MAVRRWRKQHPQDTSGRRLREALAKTKQAASEVQLPRPPPRGIPWDELRNEISPQQFVIAVFFVRLAFRSGRNAISSQVSRIAEQFRNYDGTLSGNAIGSRAPPS